MTQEQADAQAAQQAVLRAQMRAAQAQQVAAQQMALAAGTAMPGDGQVPPGALVQYYGDLSSGVLAPEDMRMEALQYRVQIAPDGSVTSESQSVMLVSRYNFAIRRIIGFNMDPMFSGAAPSLVDFNIQEDGRNFTVFKTDMSMAALVNGGNCTVAEWDGVYITVPGTQLSVVWSIDTQRWASLVGATKEFGIEILGDLVVCRGDDWAGA
jgi:hypothetical protein